MKMYSVNGREVLLLTMQDLSKRTKIPSKRLREWEREGILPRPVVVEPMRSPVYGECERRLYTNEQVNVLIKWLERYRPNGRLRLSETAKQQLHDMWDNKTKDFLLFLKGE